MHSHYLTSFISAALLCTQAFAAPTDGGFEARAASIQARAASLGLNGTYGEATMHTSPDGTVQHLAARDQPSNCRFTSFNQAKYWYYHFTDPDGREGCFGSHQTVDSTEALSFCSTSEPWGMDQIDLMIGVLRNQVNQDGGGKKSTAGHWTAGFTGWTTAIPDRNGMANPFANIAPVVLRDKSLVTGKQNRVYEYGFDGEVSIR